MKTQFIMRLKFAYVICIAAVGLLCAAQLTNDAFNGLLAAHGAKPKSSWRMKEEELRDSTEYDFVSNLGNKQMRVESGNRPEKVQSPSDQSFAGAPTISRMLDVQRDARKAMSSTLTYLSGSAAESFAHARSTMAPKTFDSARSVQAARRPKEGQKRRGGRRTNQNIFARSRPSSAPAKVHASDQLGADIFFFNIPSGTTLENSSSSSPYIATAFAATQVRTALTPVAMKATAPSLVARPNRQSTANFEPAQMGKSESPTPNPTSPQTTAEVLSPDRVAPSDNASTANLSELFRPLITRNESMAFRRSLKTLAEALNNANVTYFLYEGTLLGAYRHRGMIPWDDDMDIIANFSQEPVLRKALENVPGYTLNIWSNWLYKFIADDAVAIPGREWKWPFIDINFFNEADNRILDSSPPERGRHSYLKEDVFPLVYRPFEGLWLPVPVHEKKIVEETYGFEYCMSNNWSHKYEDSIPKSQVHSVPCEHLYKIHPFAFRNSTDVPVKETVKIGDLVVAEYVFTR